MGIIIDEYRKIYEIFAKLISKMLSSYNFKEVGYIEMGHSFKVECSNEFIGIAIEYEWGDLPELFFFDKKNKCEYSIFHLLKERAPEYEINIDCEFGIFDENIINEIIVQYIKVLLEYGSEILEGNLKVFKKLEKQKKKMLKEKEKELYG